MCTYWLKCSTGTCVEGPTTKPEHKMRSIFLHVFSAVTMKSVFLTNSHKGDCQQFFSSYSNEDTRFSAMHTERDTSFLKDIAGLKTLSELFDKSFFF